MSQQLGLFGAEVMTVGAPAQKMTESVDLGEGFDLKKFVESFPILVASLSGPALLRRAVEELAVSGRLVEGSRHEHVPGLLAQILAQRGRHVQKSPIPPRLPLRQHLPSGWIWASLDSLLLALRNGVATTPSGSTGVPVLRISAVRPNRVNMSDIRFLPGRESDYEGFFVREGDLLFTRYSGNAELVGACGVVPAHDGRLVHPDKLIRGVIVPGLLDARFVALAINVGASRAYIDQCTRTTAGQVGISGAQLKAVPVPVPPLEEQKRIVAKVDELIKLIDALEAQQAKARQAQARFRASALDALTRAAGPEELAEAWQRVAGSFEVLFERPESVEGLRKLVLEAAMRGTFCRSDGKEQPPHKLVERARKDIVQRERNRRGPRRPPPAPIKPEEQPPLPAHWAAVRWAEIGICQNGRAFPSSDYCDNGFKLLRPGNLHASGEVRWTADNTRYMPNRYAEMFPEFIVGSGELVMNLTAQSLKDEFLGRVCLTAEGESCLLNQRIARLTTVALRPRFALWFFRCPFFRRYVDGLNQGTLIQHMFTSQVDEAVIIVPPLEDQDATVAKVDALMKLCDDLEAQLKAKEATAAKLVEAVVRELVGASGASQAAAAPEAAQAAAEAAQAEEGEGAEQPSGVRRRGAGAAGGGGTRPRKKAKPV